MKKLFTLPFILFSFFAKADYWTQKADFGGGARWGAVGFAIGTKGYLGMGVNGLVTAIDFWEYDPVTNAWVQKADFGGVARSGTVGFSIGNKGYIGTGLSLTGPAKDFWEYDPATDTWTQKADFGGAPRYYATGFAIGNKGYIGTGISGATGFYKDFWEYDPTVNSWTSKMDFGGQEIYFAVSFSDGIKGYLGVGTDINIWPLGNKVFWEWDPINNTWTQKADFAGFARTEACAFCLSPFGYVGGGTICIGSGTVADFWKFDIANNAWSQVADFGGGLREMAVAFAIGTKGYVGTGWIDDDSLKADFWEYCPDNICPTGMPQLSSSNFNFEIIPNLVRDFMVISYPTSAKGKVSLTLIDIDGKKIYETILQTSHYKLQTSNYSKGIYLVELSNGKQKAVKKFVKE